MKTYLKTFSIYVGCGLLIPLLYAVIAGSLTDMLYIYNFIFEEILVRHIGHLPLAYIIAYVLRLLLTASFALLGKKRFKTGLILELAISVLNAGATIRMLMLYEAT
jgi:hypothetical protein